MIREFSIKNYKSIVDLHLELGRINLFIGENGCGKTNILEAMAMAAAAVTNRLDNEEIYNRGVRIAKPEITFSSFTGLKPRQTFEFACTSQLGSNTHQHRFKLRATSPASGAVPWEVENDAWGKLKPLLAKAKAAAKRGGAKSVRVSPGEDFLKTLSTLLEDKKETIVSAVAEGVFRAELADFLIYNANHLALRGLLNLSRKEPLGVHGENLDVTIASLGDDGIRELLERSALIRWVERIFTDPDDKLKFEGFRLGRSTSTLYFRDRFMRKRANLFSAENANEGILHALFYLTLFISDRTPKMFGIDNIETALNPRLCRNLVKQLGDLAKAHDKQALITTHNPAALDGLDLHDDEQRLFVVSRDDQGRTVANRIKLKPESKGKEPRLMLSEMWMRGQLGGVPLEF